VSWSRNQIDLPRGKVATNLARTRVSYSFSPRTFVQGLVQYNDAADVWSANVRFGWLQEASTGLFIVYNDTQYFDDAVVPPAGERLTTGRSLVIKVSRLFDLLK
jgi:hypothetical protein